MQPLKPLKDIIFNITLIQPMRYLVFSILLLALLNCTNKNTSKTIVSPANKLIGTWKMVYAEIKENDSIKVKDLSSTNFIKIINNSHFAFFNQEKHSSENFYGGAGTYTLNGEKYIETLSYTSVEAIKNHEFPFTIEIKGDTLIQSGIEEVKEAGINREIIEKYIKNKLKKYHNTLKTKWENSAKFVNNGVITTLINGERVCNAAVNF